MLVNITGEYCSLYGNFSPIVRIVIEFSKKYSNGLVHACPYVPQKKIGVENFPAEELLNKALKVFADTFKVKRGEYIATYTSRDRKGNVTFYFKSFVTVSQKKVKYRN